MFWRELRMQIQELELTNRKLVSDRNIQIIQRQAIEIHLKECNNRIAFLHKQCNEYERTVEYYKTACNDLQQLLIEKLKTDPAMRESLQTPPLKSDGGIMHPDIAGPT